ncbi:hypothetical protein Csa_019203 [Cucumis sativus]|uniref:Uncharacterized protein n=1 Tax=Cucumis sativus TaxID=3659 RepID=A0A0A0LIF9_CUCSA|nr:hypothetical protein Csa_019203 [Cucumis sativus]
MRTRTEILKGTPLLKPAFYHPCTVVHFFILFEYKSREIKAHFFCPALGFSDKLSLEVFVIWVSVCCENHQHFDCFL